MRELRGADEEDEGEECCSVGGAKVCEEVEGTVAAMVARLRVITRLCVDRAVCPSERGRAFVESNSLS